MVKPLPKAEAGAAPPNTKGDVAPVKQAGTTPEDTSKRSKDSPYKHDLEERLRETVDRIRSKNFDDVVYLPDKIPNVRLQGTVQCCLKKKRRFFQRTGKIRQLQVCLTRRDNLIIYRKRAKGLILPLSAVKKTSVSTQAFAFGNERRIMVCRYRLVFDIGTVNLFFANGSIPTWRDALDEIIDNYARSQYTLPYEQQQTAMSTCPQANDKVSLKSESQHSSSTVSCDERSDRQEATSSISYRSLKISPATQSTVSCTEDAVKEHVKSVRRGKRSVASLRARFQRRFCGHPVQKKETVEPTEICEPPTVVNNLEQDRLVPPMRQGMYLNDDAPPLPVNPPPALSNTSPYIPSTMKKKVVASSPVTLKPPPPAPPHPSPQSYKESQAFTLTPLSESSPEFYSDVQATTIRKVVASTTVTQPVQSSTPRYIPSPVFEPSLTPKKPPRATPTPIPEKSPRSECVRHGILVTHTRRPSTAATMPPEKFDYKVTSTKQIIIQDPPTRRPDTVRFSISSDQSLEDDDLHGSVSESTQSVRLEDLPADVTQHSEYPDTADSLVGAQDDEEWWQHSHAA